MAIGKISEDLKSAQDYLFQDQVVPQNATVTGDANLVGGTNGALEIKAISKTALAITDGTTITISLTGSDTEDGTFVPVGTVFTLTASAGSGAIIAGTELGQGLIPTPENPAWLKAVVTTTDASATGQIDVYIKNLVR